MLPSHLPLPHVPRLPWVQPLLSRASIAGHRQRAAHSQLTPQGPCPLHPSLLPPAARGSLRKASARLLLRLQSSHFFLFSLGRRSSSYCSLGSRAHPPLSPTVPSLPLCHSLRLLSLLSSPCQVPTPTSTFAEPAFASSKTPPHPAYTLFQLEEHVPSETPLAESRSRTVSERSLFPPIPWSQSCSVTDICPHQSIMLLPEEGQGTQLLGPLACLSSYTVQ